jgi:hypothetical protein|tara:strand:- start:577 stop:942 length:366 start_codon:yes stop_codon:yes gene_type:complete
MKGIHIMNDNETPNGHYCYERRYTYDSYKKGIYIDGNLIDRCELCNKKRKDLYKFYYTELNDTERKYILVCHKDVKELLKCYPENSSNYIYWYLPPEQREIVALMRLKKKYDISSKNNSNK